jgi:hypothetical protein
VPTSVGWFFDVFKNNCQFQVFEKIKIMILGIGTNSDRATSSGYLKEKNLNQRTVSSGYLKEKKSESKNHRFQLFQKEPQGFMKEPTVF